MSLVEIRTKLNLKTMQVFFNVHGRVFPIRVLTESVSVGALVFVGNWTSQANKLFLFGKLWSIFIPQSLTSFLVCSYEANQIKFYSRSSLYRDPPVYDKCIIVYLLLRPNSFLCPLAVNLMCVNDDQQGPLGTAKPYLQH